MSPGARSKAHHPDKPSRCLAPLKARQLSNNIPQALSCTSMLDSEQQSQSPCFDVTTHQTAALLCSSLLSLVFHMQTNSLAYVCSSRRGRNDDRQDAGELSPTHCRFSFPYQQDARSQAEPCLFVTSQPDGCKTNLICSEKLIAAEKPQGFAGRDSALTSGVRVLTRLILLCPTAVSALALLPPCQGHSYSGMGSTGQAMDTTDATGVCLTPALVCMLQA